MPKHLSVALYMLLFAGSLLMGNCNYQPKKEPAQVSNEPQTSSVADSIRKLNESVKTQFHYNEITAHMWDYELINALLKDTVKLNSIAYKLKQKHAKDQNQGAQMLMEKDAIPYAESILFKVYGEKWIKLERPYDVSKSDDYWLMNGNLPKGYDGGVFEIIFNSTTGRVIYLAHSK